MKFERLNPLTGMVASHAPAMRAPDIAAVCERAQAAFPTWAAIGPTALRAMVMEAADALEARAADSLPP